MRLVLIHSVPSYISSPSGFLVATVGGFPRFLTLQFLKIKNKKLLPWGLLLSKLLFNRLFSNLARAPFRAFFLS